VRALVVRSLADAAPATAAAAVEAAAGDESVHVRRAAAFVAASPHGPARLGAAASGRLIADPDPHTRALATRALGRLAVPDRTVAAVAALRDPDPRVRVAAAAYCAGPRAGCLDDALGRLAETRDAGESLALVHALAAALAREPARWLPLLDGAPEVRAITYAGLARAPGGYDTTLASRLAAESDPRALEALVRAVGERRVAAARAPLLRLVARENRSLALAATDALARIGLDDDAVSLAVDLLREPRDIQTSLDLVRVLEHAERIAAPRAWDVLEPLRRTPRMDHHLARALVGAYARLDDPRGEPYRVDRLHYDNFGYHYWLHGLRTSPPRPRAGDDLVVRTVWTIRWNQPPDARNALVVDVDGDATTTLRDVVAGLPVSRWPTCRIMVDETTIRVPPGARRLRVSTGWRRDGRLLPVVYGERADETHALLLDVDVEPARAD
jgi:hypothetical protein